MYAETLPLHDESLCRALRSARRRRWLARAASDACLALASVSGVFVIWTLCLG